MARRLPKPAITLTTPTFEISDSTAYIKAQRLMKELKTHANQQNWLRTNQQLGVQKERSQSKKWRALLDLPRKRQDIIGIWLDKAGRPMERPDPKRTAELVIFMLAAATPHMQGEDPVADGKEELFFSAATYNRTAVLYPDRGPKDDRGLLYSLMKISFHSLQRMIQRGYGLSEDGEISYQRLLHVIDSVWDDATDLYEQQEIFPAEFKLVFAEATFVVKAFADTSTMDLVTVLPPKK